MRPVDAGKPGEVRILIPSMLRGECGGARELLTSGPTVGEALGRLERSHLGLYRSICDETGAVRRHVNVFINTSNIRDLASLETQVAAGDVIYILPAVSGGSRCRTV